jgi:signal transduction histidine kinase
LQVEASGEPAETYADEMAARRVISNLVDNAIKFTPEKGEVTIRTYVKDSTMVTVEVEDTGVGISEEALPRVFEAFTQESEGLTREYEGAGLGLSIVQGLVEALGGKIEVETEKGEGTCISVHLPRPTEQ